jgi:hypothetical protein
MRRFLVPSVYAALIVAAIGLLVLNALAWTGGLVHEPVRTRATAAEPAAEPPPTLLTPEPQPVSRRVPRPERNLGATSLALSATRGDCWVEVRAGSATGDVFYAGTLLSGKTIRFHRKKLWLRLGAASNVDVVVNGRPSTVPPGTVELVLPV